MTAIARLAALCCICGEFRTLSDRTYGRVGGVSAPLEPEFLRECQSRGVYLDVEAHWRHLRVLKCHHCGEWTRHAVITAGPTAADDEDKPVDERLRWNPSGEELEAEFQRLDVKVYRVDRLHVGALYLEEERIVILNDEASDDLLSGALVNLLPEIWQLEPPCEEW